MEMYIRSSMTAVDNNHHFNYNLEDLFLQVQSSEVASGTLNNLNLFALSNLSSNFKICNCQDEFFSARNV